MNKSTNISNWTGCAIIQVIGSLHYQRLRNYFVKTVSLFSSVTELWNSIIIIMHICMDKIKKVILNLKDSFVDLNILTLFWRADRGNVRLRETNISMLHYQIVLFVLV